MKSIKIQTEHGFTILEVMLSVMIIGIMALLAIPRILDTDRRAAYITAHQIVADMRLARSMSIANADRYSVGFVLSEGRYVGYQIFRTQDKEEDGDVDDVIKSMMIPDQLTFEPDEVNGGWAPDLIFTFLGNIENAGTGSIAHVTGGGHQVNIEATVATGKVSVQ